MPRKAFLADLDKAVSGVSTTGIDGVKREEGEEFTFLCTAEGQPLRITALVSGMPYTGPIRVLLLMPHRYR